MQPPSPIVLGVFFTVSLEDGGGNMGKNNAETIFLKNLLQDLANVFHCPLVLKFVSGIRD